MTEKTSQQQVAEVNSDKSKRKIGRSKLSSFYSREYNINVHIICFSCETIMESREYIKCN